MRSSHNNHQQTSLLAYDFCDADKISSLIKPEDKLLVRSYCPGNYRNMVDCHCEDIQLFIDEVHGMDFNTKNIVSASPLITQSIPVIPKESFDRKPETISSDIVGVRLGDILSHQPYRNNAGILRFNDKVRIDLAILKRPVFQGKRIILFATGIDIVIETIWYKQADMNLFKEIAAANFYAVTGMNFSLFLHECPLGHLVNLNKSLLFCERLSELGVHIVPHIYAINDTHRTMWTDYLQRHPNIKTVLINTQMQRDSASMHEVKLTVAALIENTNVNVILNGRQPKSPLWSLGGRVFAAQQFGLKKQALIEKDLARRRKAVEAPLTKVGADVHLHRWALNP